MHRTFETPHPIHLTIELGAGDVTVTASDTTTTTVTLSGPEAEETEVTHQGRSVAIIAPKRKLRLFGSGGLTVVVGMPRHSDVKVASGSADVDLRGEVGVVAVKTGSGDVAVESATDVETVCGSGDQRLGTLSGRLHSRTGSGGIRAATIAGEVSLVSGSGDFTIEEVGSQLSSKTGSGDLSVQQLHGDAEVTSASGDISIARMTSGAATVRTASGNVRVGAAHGTPVWTDISTVSGRVVTQLESLGQPAEGQPHLEWRLRSVSGDIHLSHV